MRRLNLLGILIICLMICFTALLPAEKLARDVNGATIQLSRYWTCTTDTIPAQPPATKDSLAVPSDAAEAVVIFQHAGGYIRPTAGATTVIKWMYVPVGVPITLPVMNITYLVYRSYTGANNINIVWKRM